MKLIPFSSRAFSLVEVTLALGLGAFALVAIFGLLPIGINSNQASVAQTAAAGIAGNIAADLRISISGSAAATSQIYKFAIPAAGANGTPSVQTVFFDGTSGGGVMGGAPLASASSTSFYRAAVSFYPSTTGGSTTAARIRITWPALADRSPNSDPKNYAGAFEVNTIFDRKK